MCYNSPRRIFLRLLRGCLASSEGANTMAAPAPGPGWMNTIPVIAVSGLTSAQASERAGVAAELGRACREIGFFYAIDHGIPEFARDALFAAARPSSRKHRKIYGKAPGPQEPVSTGLMLSPYQTGRGAPSVPPCWRALLAV